MVTSVKQQNDIVGFINEIDRLVNKKIENIYNFHS